jgi:anaerobic ribonucleoside-triphosphate reductase activating protein
MLRAGRVLHGTTAEGPGLRTAVWVQGCSIRCPGCVNPHLFAPRGGELVEPAGIVKNALGSGAEGLTLLGGEPFDQPSACAEVARRAHLHNLGVICFTGYTLEALRSQPSAAPLLQHVDLLIDGPFMANQRDNLRSLVGSTNQRFIHLSDRYAGYDPRAVPNRLELRVKPSGETEAAGFLSSEAVTALADLLESRREHKRISPGPVA